MADIKLPQQVINVAELESQFPAKGFKTRKIFFHCELRRIEANGDAVFGIIGYAAWRRNNNDRIPWQIGITPARGADVPEGFVLSHPVDNGNTNPALRHVAFGNNEIPWEYHPRFTDADDEKAYKQKDDEKEPVLETDFYKQLKKILSDKALLATSKLNFKAKISDNPHVTYTVTLDSGQTEVANPCPPNQPKES